MWPFSLAKRVKALEDQQTRDKCEHPVWTLHLEDRGFLVCAQCGAILEATNPISELTRRWRDYIAEVDESAHKRALAYGFIMPEPHK